MKPDLPPVYADGVQIQQVLINPVRNAVEAMHALDRRVLNITTRKLRDGVSEVQVIDSGPGIPPEITDRLFRPFVTTSAFGMGLGLSICREIESYPTLWWRSHVPHDLAIRVSAEDAGGDG